MFDEVLGLDEDFQRYSPPLDLKDPQPWFLMFTCPILECEKKKEEKLMFPWPPGAPRPIVEKTEFSLQEVLDLIYKPYRFKENGLNWRQQVSDAPANRTYAHDLNAKLEEILGKFKSRNDGLCPFRNRVMSDMFSEVIRIVAVGMKERGLLLIKVKDDIEASLKHYDKMYRSSMAYGIRKQLKLEERKIEMELKVPDMRENTELIEDLAKKYATLCELMLEAVKRKREALYKKRVSDLRILKRIAFVIEQTMLEIIRDVTAKKRRNFIKAARYYKTDEELKKMKEGDTDVMGLFTDIKSSTPSSCTLDIGEITPSEAGSSAGKDASEECSDK